MSFRTRLSRRKAALAFGIGVMVMGIYFWNGAGFTDRIASLGRATIKRPPPPPNDYVGSESCRQCHPAIWEKYQSHPMSQSAARVDRTAPLEDFEHWASFTVQTNAGDKVYRVERNDDGQVHCESFQDSSQRQIYDQRVRVEYAIGSGRHGRSYVFAKGNQLYMSPVSWYSQNSKWDLSPGYELGTYPGFERRILQRCIVCHMDRVDVGREEPDQFPAASIVEPRIGCERCHGPGGGHIAFHQRKTNHPAEKFADVDSIVNPARLDSVRRESVCWQCHFSSEERVPRYGRMDSDFRPGMSFDDVWIAFVKGDRVDSQGLTQAVSHVEQLRVSKCFQREPERFGCVTCHDPHGLPSEENKIQFYRERCLNCHADRGCSLPVEERTRLDESDSCVRCHMPSRGLNGVPHTAQTDHRVLRRPAAPIEATSDHQLTIFQTGDGQVPLAEQERAWGIVLATIATAKQDVKTARQAREKLLNVRESFPDDLEILKWLGTCERIDGQFDRARQYWEKILNIHPDDESALKRLADLSILGTDPVAARDALRRYLNVNPWQGHYLSRLAGAYASTGDLDAAERTAKEAIRVNPSISTPYGVLAEIYNGRGDQAEFKVNLRRFQRLELLK